MAMLITPDREQMTPVSAPSMIGIDPASVPCSRFTTLNEVVCPAPAQHSSETMNRNMTTAMATRRQHHAQRQKGPRRRQRDGNRAAHVAGDGGGQRSGSARDLGERRENAKVASPECAKTPSTKMSMSPKSRNAAGASHRRKALTGGGARLQHGGDALGDRHAFHPLDITLDAAAPGRAQSVDGPDQRRRRDEQHDDRLQHLDHVHRGAGRGLHSGAPACSAPNSRPASTTPSGRPRPSRATVMASIP